MSEHRFADRAAEWLRAGRDSVGPRPKRAPEPTIAAIADAIRAQPRRRRARMALTAGALALAAGGAGIWLVHARPSLPPSVAQHAPLPTRGQTEPATVPTVEAGAFTVARAGSALFDSRAGAHPPTPGGTFTSGHSLSSGGEPATLTGTDGTIVHLDPHTEIALVRADTVRWFQLQRGTLEAHVSKLAPGNRFVVATPDRQVEVRGTRFHVSVVPAEDACADGTVTRVTVDEGVVTVRAPGRAEDRVTAGQPWPSACAPPRHAAHPAADHPKTRRPDAASRAAQPTRAARAAAPPTSSSLSPSTLAAENDLFGQAARAARAGDTAAALGLLDELVARYPESPLRSAAESERARLLERAK